MFCAETYITISFGNEHMCGICSEMIPRLDEVDRIPIVDDSLEQRTALLDSLYQCASILYIRILLCHTSKSTYVQCTDDGSAFVSGYGDASPTGWVIMS